MQPRPLPEHPIPTIVVENEKQLRQIVLKTIRTQGPQCSLNHLDVSAVTSMDGIFRQVDFKGDISQWNTGNVLSMQKMFDRSSFNGDISQWDVSKVQRMDSMFLRSSFNGDISKWNVSSVISTEEMFRLSLFTGDLSAWRLDRLRNGREMFHETNFQGGLPCISGARAPHFGKFPVNYRGTLSDNYALEDLLQIFSEKRWVDSYLESTFAKRVDRVHLEKALSVQNRPRWFTDKDLYKWLVTQQDVCEQLGLDDTSTRMLVLQQFKSRSLPPSVPQEVLNLSGSVFESD